MKNFYKLLFVLMVLVLSPVCQAQQTQIQNFNFSYREPGFSFGIQSGPYGSGISFGINQMAPNYGTYQYIPPPVIFSPRIRQPRQFCRQTGRVQILIDGNFVPEVYCWWQ